MYITINETTLYFDVEGSGLVSDGPTMCERPTLLLLHGGPGHDHVYFKPALSALSDTAQLIYLDLRGQGRSGRPPLDTCIIVQMADDAATLCRNLGIARPVVLGHSFGGFVALHMALRHPDLMGRLILVDTAASRAYLSEAMAILEDRHGTEARKVAEQVAAGDSSEAAMADFGRLVFPAYFRDFSKARWFHEALARASFNAEVASHFARHGAAKYDVVDRLGEIRMPTLVVVGDYDWRTPPSASRVLAAGIAGAELRVIPDAGHFPFGEQSEAFAAAVRRFLIEEPTGVGDNAAVQGVIVR